MNNSKFRLFFPCYYSFFVNGALVLMVGAILPYIIEEMGINYSIAGGFLSAFAIGNLLASFVNPVLAAKIGRKATIVSMSLLIPVMFFCNYASSAGSCYICCICAYRNRKRFCKYNK